MYIGNHPGYNLRWERCCICWTASTNWNRVKAIVTSDIELRTKVLLDAQGILALVDPRSGSVPVEKTTPPESAVCYRWIIATLRHYDKGCKSSWCRQDSRRLWWGSCRDVERRPLPVDTIPSRLLASPGNPELIGCDFDWRTTVHSVPRKWVSAQVGGRPFDPGTVRMWPPGALPGTLQVAVTTRQLAHD